MSLLATNKANGEALVKLDGDVKYQTIKGFECISVDQQRVLRLVHHAYPQFRDEISNDKVIKVVPGNHDM